MSERSESQTLQEALLVLEKESRAALLRAAGYTQPEVWVTDFEALLQRVIGAQPVALQPIRLDAHQVWQVQFQAGPPLALFIYDPVLSGDCLKTLLQIQRVIGAQHYPVAEVCGPPQRLGQAWISLESWREGERLPQPQDERDIRQMAFALARLHQATCTLRHLPHLPTARLNFNPRSLTRTKQLSPEFDWLLSLIQPLQRRLRQDGGREVLGPVCWRPDQLRMSGTQVSAVYGLKNLSLELELQALSQLVAHFTCPPSGEPPVPPAPVAIKRFLAAFEEARGVPFVVAELRYLEAGITWAMVCTAWQEQCEDPNSQHWAGSYREALSRQAQPYYVGLV